jgi:HEAT repeat protein
MKKVTTYAVFACISLLSLGVALGGEPVEKPVKEMKQLPPEIAKQIDGLIEEGDFIELIDLWDKYGGQGVAYKENNETFRRALLSFKLEELNMAFFRAWSQRSPFIYLPSYNVLEVLKDKKAMHFLAVQIDVRPVSDKDKGKIRTCIEFQLVPMEQVRERKYNELIKMGPKIRQVMREYMGVMGAGKLDHIYKQAIADTELKNLTKNIKRLNLYDSPELVPYYTALLGSDEKVDTMSKYYMLSLLAKHGKEKDGEGCIGYKQGATAVANLLDDEKTARAAAICLGKLGDKTCLKKIEEFARKKGDSADAKDYVQAMAMLGDKSILNSWLASDKNETREWGADILAKIASEDDIPAILKLIEGKPEAYYVYYAAQGIEKIGTKDEKIRAALKEAYANAQRHRYPADLDYTVKRTLILMGDKDVEKQLFESLKKEKDGIKKMQIIDEIGNIRTKTHIPGLIKYLDDETVVYEERIAPHIPQTISEAARMAIIKISGADYLGLWPYDKERTKAEIEAWYKANSSDE